MRIFQGICVQEKRNNRGLYQGLIQIFLRKIVEGPPGHQWLLDFLRFF